MFIFICFSVLIESRLFKIEIFESLLIAKRERELIVINKKTMINEIRKRFSPIGICLKLIALLISLTCLYNV